MASVQIVNSIGLPDSGTSTQTSTICEPTAASDGKDLFVTGNWFASVSRDAGGTWTLVDPFSALPKVAGGFCCDQIVLFDPSRRIWIWILQYARNGGSNVFRIAVSKSGNLRTWHWWDFSPRGVNSNWTEAWFDYPDAALSSNHLFVTFNVFNAADQWLRAVAFKFPLDNLASGAGLGYRYWDTTTNGSLRLTQGATSTMFFASHNGTNPLRVFRWPDGPGGISSFTVNTAAWSASSYTGPTPTGVNWLDRLDSRITGAWVVGTRAGFLWTAASSNGRPRPYVKAAVVDTASGALVEQPDLWHSKLALAYPAACPNTKGVVGVSLAYASAAVHTSHLVGIQDGGTWRLAVGRSGTDTAPDGRWGDYCTCHRHSSELEWVASGYTLQGGTDRRNIEPQYVQFKAV